jgi:hypothetical protein
VRKKLRTAGQLLARSSAGQKRRGLQGINHPVLTKRVRNFLRTPTDPLPTAPHHKHRIVNKHGNKTQPKKSPDQSGLSAFRAA